SVAQGSASVALAGVAHKISVPQELIFGIVIMGNPKQRSLTIRNEGTTTINLTLSTSQADLEILSERTLNLAPDASQVVTLRFTPTATGNFQRKLFLTSGPSTIEISAAGKTYNNIQEYLQELLDAYNNERRRCYQSLNPDCGLGILRSTMPDRDFELWLAGFRELTPTQLNNFWGFAGDYNPAQNTAELVELAGILVEFDNLNPDLLTQWRQRLLDALSRDQFDAEYALLLQDARFAQYHQLLGRLLRTQDEAQIKEFVRRTITDPSPLPSLDLDGLHPLVLDLIAYLANSLLPRLVAEGHLTQAQTSNFWQALDNAARALGNVRDGDGFWLMYKTSAILIQFDLAQMHNIGQMPSYSYFVEKLQFALLQIRDRYDYSLAWRDKIMIAGQGALAGWFIIDFIVPLDSNGNRLTFHFPHSMDPDGRFIDIIAWTGNALGTRTVLFLKVDYSIIRDRSYHGNIFETLKAMILHVNANMPVSNLYGTGINDIMVIGYIFSRPQDPSRMNILAQDLTRNLPETSAPVFLAFTDRYGNRYIIIICTGSCSNQAINAAIQAACDFFLMWILGARTLAYIPMAPCGAEVTVISRSP
ncbi:MAG: hypothetical protein NZV61_07765, partial [Candidatus Bipolaricaulota bacterium]|nr:hypothetical protein [Candidatus Bipolaricaulota bacterium]